MNGMPLEKMDAIIHSLCFLCWEHKRSGFVNGVQIGMLLTQKLEKKLTRSRQGSWSCLFYRSRITIWTVSPSPLPN